MPPSVHVPGLTLEGVRAACERHVACDCPATVHSRHGKMKVLGQCGMRARLHLRRSTKRMSWYPLADGGSLVGTPGEGSGGCEPLQKQRCVHHSPAR